MRVTTIINNIFNKDVTPNSIPDPKVDATFRKIPKLATCFSVWKITEKSLDAIAKSSFGTFQDDCAYIVYAASRLGTHVNKDTLTRENKKGVQLQRFIHFWLGANVSDQTRSNVAHKIKELDSYFGNVASQYRETQYNECARFLSYFKSGITIISGKQIDAPEFPRMFVLYGRKSLRCIEMDSISWKHFDSSYVIFLLTENNIFIWIGRSSSAIERRLALEHITKYNSTNLKITIVDDGYEQSLNDELKSIWNALLPLSKRNVNQSSLISSTSLILNPEHKMSIYKCVYRDTRLNLDQLDIPVFPTKEELNDPSTVFVLDCKNQGVWLWVGSLASSQDKMNALGNGRAFIKKKKYPFTTPVMRVVEGYEPIEFTRLFPHWSGDISDIFSNNMKPISTMLGKFDALTLCQRPKMAADTQIVDDGHGERTIYRVSNDDITEMAPSKLTVFTTNQCYVVKYSVVYASVTQTDIEHVGIKTIIYQWNGAEANADVIAKTDNYARKMFQNMRDKVMFVQMSEFDETPHFLQIFDGKLIITQNDVPVQHQILHKSPSNTNTSNGGGSKTNIITSNNLNNNSESKTSLDGKISCKTSITTLGQKYYTLRIYGNASYNSKAVEVYPLSSFNSKDCYIVKRNHIWVWCGQSSTGDAREVAKSIGNLLGECSLVMEGKEPKEFWFSDNAPPLILNSTNTNNNNIHNNSNSTHNSSAGTGSGSASPQSVGSSSGGYTSGYMTPPSKIKHRFQPQLFLVWLHRKDFFSQEIFGYDQTDLNPECIYILDAGLIIFIWLGANCSITERERYLTMAHRYIEQIPIARRPTTALAVIRQNDEPNVFKGFFDSWDINHWADHVSYEVKRKQYSDNSNETCTSTTSNCSSDSFSLLNNQKDFDEHIKYPINVLQQDIDNLPTDVNPLKREVHLTHDDFVSLFKISFFEFVELPTWKQKEMKKLNKLF